MPCPCLSSHSAICSSSHASWIESPAPSLCAQWRSEEHTSELQSLTNLVCRLLLEKNKRRGRIVKMSSGNRINPSGPKTCSSSHSHSLMPSPCINLPPGRRTRRNGWRFFFNDTATTEIYTLSLHDALPI